MPSSSIKILLFSLLTLTLHLIPAMNSAFIVGKIVAINGAALCTGYKVQHALLERTKDFGTKLARYGKTAEASAPLLKFILGLVIPFGVNQACRRFPLPGAVSRFTSGPWRHAFSSLGVILATLYCEDREAQAALAHA